MGNWIPNDHQRACPMKRSRLQNNGPGRDLQKQLEALSTARPRRDQGCYLPSGYVSACHNRAWAGLCSPKSGILMHPKRCMRPKRTSPRSDSHSSRARPAGGGPFDRPLAINVCAVIDALIRPCHRIFLHCAGEFSPVCTCCVTGAKSVPSHAGHSISVIDGILRRLLQCATFHRKPSPE